MLGTQGFGSKATKQTFTNLQNMDNTLSEFLGSYIMYTYYRCLNGTLN